MSDRKQRESPHAVVVVGWHENKDREREREGFSLVLQGPGSTATVQSLRFQGGRPVTCARVTRVTCAHALDRKRVGTSDGAAVSGGGGWAGIRQGQSVVMLSVGKNRLPLARSLAD